MATRSHWLVKSEPFKYSWDEFVSDGSTYWDGVRNALARNNLRAMRKGDLVLYYHSNEGKEVVGIARVTKTAYQDPTTDDDRWVVVDLAPVKALKQAVPLGVIGQGQPLDVLHGEEGPRSQARVGGARLEDLGDARVLQAAEHLGLDLEAAQQLAAGQAPVDELEGHAAFDRAGLLRQVDDAHAALAEGLEDPVGANRVSRPVAPCEAAAHLRSQLRRVRHAERLQPLAQFRHQVGVGRHHG